MEKLNESGKFSFFKPNLMKEKDEFERVGTTFDIDSSVLFFEASQGRLVQLDDGVWSVLENADSNRFGVGDFEAVKNYSEEYGRDWQDIKSKIGSLSQVDAPIVMKFGQRYHLVSGNTRLMVSRALGITPQVLLFEIDYNEKEI